MQFTLVRPIQVNHVTSSSDSRSKHQDQKLKINLALEKKV